MALGRQRHPQAQKGLFSTFLPLHPSHVEGACTSATSCPLSRPLASLAISSPGTLGAPGSAETGRDPEQHGKVQPWGQAHTSWKVPRTLGLGHPTAGSRGTDREGGILIGTGGQEHSVSPDEELPVPLSHLSSSRENQD